MNKGEKKHFFNKLAANSNLNSTEQAEKVYYGLINTIMDGLREAEEIELPEWGKYYLKKYPPRKIRDVNSGNMIQIDSKKALKFDPCNQLKEYTKDMETRLSQIEED